MIDFIWSIAWDVFNHFQHFDKGLSLITVVRQFMDHLRALFVSMHFSEGAMLITVNYRVRQAVVTEGLGLRHNSDHVARFHSVVDQRPISVPHLLVLVKQVNFFIFVDIEPLSRMSAAVKHTNDGFGRHVFLILPQNFLDFLPQRGVSGGAIYLDCHVASRDYAVALFLVLEIDELAFLTDESVAHVADPVARDIF